MKQRETQGDSAKDKESEIEERKSGTYLESKKD